MPSIARIGAPDLRCASCPVHHHAVCEALGGLYLDELAGIMTHRRFEAGTEIVHQGETSHLFGIIASGVVKLTRLLPDGRQHIVCLLSETDCIGDVFSSQSHDNAMCVTDVELCCFHRTQFDDIVKSHPTLGHHLLQTGNGRPGRSAAVVNRAGPQEVLSKKLRCFCCMAVESKSMNTACTRA